MDVHFWFLTRMLCYVYLRLLMWTASWVVISSEEHQVIRSDLPKSDTSVRWNTSPLILWSCNTHYATNQLDCWPYWVRCKPHWGHWKKFHCMQGISIGDRYHFYLGMQSRQGDEVMLALYGWGTSRCEVTGIDLPFGHQCTGLFHSHGMGWKLLFLLK